MTVDLRSTAGWRATPRDVLLVAGPDAVTYLQGQLSQDVESLEDGESARSFLLQPGGKVVAWMRVTRTADDEMLIDVDAGAGELVVDRLRRFLLRTKAEITVLDWQHVAVRGPGANEAGLTAAAAQHEVLAVPANWPGIEGIDLLGPVVAPPKGLPEVDANALELARIRAGVPAVGVELTEKTIPAEAGQWVIDASVSFTKGCFTGQELVARIDSRGGNVPRHLRVVESSGAPLQSGTTVMVDGAEVGTITSAADGAEGSVGLAYIRRAVAPPAVAEAHVDGVVVAVTVLAAPLAG